MDVQLMKPAGPVRSSVILEAHLLSSYHIKLPFKRISSQFSSVIIFNFLSFFCEVARAPSQASRSLPVLTAEACITGWPNVQHQPQECDKCSVERHHQASLTVCEV